MAMMAWDTGGSGPKRLGGTLRLVCGGIMRQWGSPLEWSSRLSYVVNRLEVSYEVGGPSNLIFYDYRVNTAICGPTGSATPRPGGEPYVVSPTGPPGSR
jgi:hypothetical protein